MKKSKMMVTVIAVILAAVFVLGGCAAGETGGQDAAGGTSGKIVFAGTGLQQDQFTNVLLKGYQDKAEELGIDILVANSQLSLDKESEMINNFIQAGVQALIIEPVNSDTSAAMAEAAAAKGIPVFACAIPVNSDVVFASSINNNTALGEMAGEAAIPFLEESFGKDSEIKAAILAFDSQDPVLSEERVSGFQNKVGEFNINYVSRQDVTADDAYQVVTDILTANPDLDVIYSASENGLVGAHNAIKAAGKTGEIMVFGVDCSAQICEMMLEADIIKACVAQAPYEQGQYAVQTMYDYVVNGKEPEEKHIEFDGIVVSQKDVEGIKQFKTDWEQRSK